MPPSLALLACFALIGWALWRDHRDDPYPARLWLPTIWMMRCGSRGIDYWIGGGEAGRLDPTFIALMILFGAITLAQRRINWGSLIALNSATFIFYAYLAASVFWSQSPDDPAIKILRPLGDLIMALIVTSEPDPFGAIGKMFQRTGMVLIPLSVVLIKYFPYLGKAEDKHWGDDLWIGVTTHKNPLGQLALVSVLGLLWWIQQQRERGVKWLKLRMPAIFVLLTVYILNAGGTSRSSTAIFCVMVAVPLHYIFGRKRSNVQGLVRLMVGGGAALLILSLVLTVFGTSVQAVVGEAFGKDATLSDRTYLWRDVVRIGSEDAVLGKGYGGFWIPSLYSRLSPEVDNGPAEAHNGYLETFANLGLIGVFLLLCLIAQGARNALQLVSFDFEYARMRLVLILTVCVMNYTEATFPRGNHLWWFGFLVAALFTRSSVFWPEDSMPVVRAEEVQEYADSEGGTV